MLYLLKLLVTVRDENPLYCMSASEPSGYKWQTNITNDINGKTRVDINWADHFVNEVHEAGHFLSPVGPYEPRLTDGGQELFCFKPGISNHAIFAKSTGGI
jgi:hypothetical protein